MENIERHGHDEFQSWGFRLAIGPTELKVNRDTRAFRPAERRKRLLILLAAIIATCIFYVGTGLRIERHLHRSDRSTQRQAVDDGSGLDALDTFFSLIWPAGPIVSVLLVLYPKATDLRCTCEYVQVTRRFRGRVTHVRSFPATDVRRIQYIPETVAWFDGPGCLGFFAAGERVTCLPGLKCIEAQWILDALRERGFNVVRDPAMALRIEKEQSRRRG